MRHSVRGPTQCYVDESIHLGVGFVATAFVFASSRFDRAVAEVLKAAGMIPRKEEFKSSARMDTNTKMRSARGGLLALAGSKATVAVYFGPFDDTFQFNRKALGKHSLQALQSTLVRNSIRPSRLAVYFDREIFPTAKEAARLQSVFHFLRSCRMYPQEDSRLRLGIQVADAVAHSFGQILKEGLSGTRKIVDIGRPGSGYATGTKASLGWDLLMTLRHALLTRPLVQNSQRYDPATDPVVLDPMSDDAALYGQHPVLLGWGVQVAPDAGKWLRQGVEEVFGRICLGCIH